MESAIAETQKVTLSEASIKTCCEDIIQAIFKSIKDESFRQGIEVEDTIIDEVLCNVCGNLIAQLVINRENAYKTKYGVNDTGLETLQQYAGINFARNVQECYLRCLEQIIKIRNQQQ